MKQGKVSPAASAVTVRRRTFSGHRRRERRRAPRPRLSVIVASYNAPQTLEACLAALMSQEEAVEVVVSDCSPSDPTEKLSRRFPTVRFVHFSEPKSLPELRWAVLKHVHGDIVGTIEARCIPAKDWCARIIQAHDRKPAAATIGGPVGVWQGAPPLELGMYFSEHVAFAPPVVTGRAPAICDANLSYKRRTLEVWRSLRDEGVWEATLHDEAQRQGSELVLCDAAVEYRHDGYGFWSALKQRFHYGRSYAAERVRSQGGARALAYAASCAALPLLLTWRNWKAARGKGLSKLFVRAFAWTAALNAVWSAGELAGYAFGRPARTHIF